MAWIESDADAAKRRKAAQKRLGERAGQTPIIEMRRGNTGLNKEVFTDGEIKKHNKEKR